MAKVTLKAGTTSYIAQVFVLDTSKTDGSGLTGLTNASSGLTAYYHRDTDTTATAISLVTMTVGTFTSSGFKEIDATNMPGWYQLCPPNAALASGAKSVGIHLKGATNMAALPLEIELTAVDNQSAATFLTGVNGIAPPSNWNLLAVDANGRVSARVDVQKNTALNNFMFLMTDAVNHQPMTGLVDGTFTLKKESLDGAAPASLTGTVTEISAANLPGFYKINFTAGELNGDVIAIELAATGADTTALTIKTSA